MIHLEAIDAGHSASLADAAVRPYIEKQIAAINNRMIAAYRDRETPDREFFALAAELMALRNLQEDLNSDLKRGIHALNQEIINAEAHSQS
jgi:hypothetical protein